MKEGFNRWGRPARVLLLVLLTIFYGNVQAEAAPNIVWQSASEPVKLVIRDAAKLTTSEVQNIRFTSPNATVTRSLPKLGKYVPYVGQIVMAASAVNSAMEWYYNQATSAFGGSLDDCKAFSKGKGFTTLSFCAEVDSAPKSPGYGTFPQPSGSFAIPNTIPWFGNFASSANSEPHFYVHAYVYEGQWDANYRDCKGNMSSAQKYDRQRIQALYDSFIRLMAANGCIPAAKRLVDLEEYYRGSDDVQPHPDIPANISNVQNTYVDRYQFDNAPSDASPMPGVTLNPKPAPDQIVDSPDPTSREVISTKRETIRDPDGSTTTRTTTEYSDGTKKVVEVTVSKTTTTNPDGSKTTRTTTTTKTQEYDKDGNPVGPPEVKQKTEEEVTPAPDPEPEPPTEEGPCVAAGGTWGGEPPACTMPEKEPETEVPTFDKPEPFKPPNFDLLKTKWNDQLKNLSEATKDKFPFGLVNPVQSLSMSGVDGEGSPCPPLRFDVVSLPDAKIGMDVDACGTVGAKYTHDYLRPLVSWLLIGMTVFACARVAGQA